MENQEASIKYLREGHDDSVNKENHESAADISETSINASDNNDLDEWLTNTFQKHLQKVILLFNLVEQPKEATIKADC
jgi:hypothetical protein